MAKPTPQTASTSSLTRRIVLWTGVALFVVLAILASVGRGLISDRVMRRTDATVLQAAQQAALVIDRVVAERERQVRLLASLPAVVDAARLAATRAEQLGLVQLPLETAEQRFDSTRTLGVDPRTRKFLLDRSISLDLAEVLVTERHGYNAITTERTSDFVQNDEQWWQRAMAEGLSPAIAAYDESAKRATISVASAVREIDDSPSVGVMKVVYGLVALQEAVNTAATQGVVSVELIDGTGRVIASSKHEASLAPLAGHAHLPQTEQAGIVRYDDGAMQRASVRSTNRESWRVVAHSPEAIPRAEIKAATLALGAGGFGVLLLVLGILAAMNAFMTRRITTPAAMLATAAESVAAGDLSIRLTEWTADDEIGRLGRATSAMIRGLRTLTVAIKGSAADAAVMASDLTANSEEISASSQQVAHTASDLSRQSAEMAQTIHAMAQDSARLSSLSTGLTTGAAEGVKRNQRLRALAQQNRALLDASARELQGLVLEAESTLQAGEALAAASEEIREFVFLVQNIARQSKLLAFSAGMEASRAGQEGAGFTVVAKEVERLAVSSSDAAERTEKVVTSLLDRVAESRALSGRAAAAAERLRKATQNGLESFANMEAMVMETEAWTVAIEQTSNTSHDVIEETTRRLADLAHGTEMFAAAMEEVAAATEEQSSGTEAIAGTAEALASAAEQLSAQAGAFRLERPRT